MAATSIKGSVLVASPQLGDPNFRRTVVLMAEHKDEGSFGLVLNRPGKMRVAQLWEAIADTPCSSEALTFVGGPVQPSAVFLLHACEDFTGESEQILPGVWMGSDVDLLGGLLERERALRERGEPRDVYRVFCGYSGWGSGQLDRELEAGGWLVQSASRSIIFDTPADRLWQRSMRRQGGGYRIFGMMPPDPDLN